MKIDINVLMIVLVVVFIASFSTVIIYGEIWRISLLMSNSYRKFDHARTVICFIASCVSIISGSLILYFSETRFSQSEIQRRNKPYQSKNGNFRYHHEG